jgi:hypothetical protein
VVSRTTASCFFAAKSSSLSQMLARHLGSGYQTVREGSVIWEA